MDSNIIVALIGLGGSALGTVIGIMSSAKLTAYRIKQLEIKVDKHNTVVERTYKLEENDALIDEKLTVINHRIKDLEEERKNA